MTPTPYPLYLEPQLSRRLWGDSSLETYLNLRPAGAGDPWGESWQVWAGNRILNGPLAGRTLQAAADLWGDRLLGSAAVGTQVPLLAKFIAAGQDLSLQVHPDDAYALSHHAGSGHLGKAEAWLILQARPDAAIYWGFRETVTAEVVRVAAADGTLDRLLNRVPVAAGDVIYNPPGTVHAIGAGIILYEIQQSSDLTFRLYDYGRRDSKGNLRELHLEEGLAVASLEGGQAAKVTQAPGARELLATPHFVLTTSVPGQYLQQTAASFELLTAVEGDITLAAAGTELKLPAGTSLVLPAAEQRYSVGGSGRLLSARLPQQNQTAG